MTEFPTGLHHDKRGFRWAVFGGALIALTTLPRVDGATYRTDLPDNGLRFLPLDTEKIIPSSSLLVSRAVEADGDPAGLRRSFIALLTILPILASMLALLAWMRRRKDHLLYDSLFQTRLSEMEALARSQTVNSELSEQKEGLSGRTLVASPSGKEREEPAEMGDLEKGIRPNEAPEAQNEEKKAVEGAQPHVLPPLNQGPGLQGSHPAEEAREPYFIFNPTLPLSPGSAPPATPAKPVGPVTPINPAPVPSAPPILVPQTISDDDDDAMAGSPNTSDKEYISTTVNSPLEDVQVKTEEDVPISIDRKIKVDSILVYCQKQKKLSQQS
ncbi:hypothetical protein VP01_1857g3 [Puccinia sorghi]|uniref:Uncharacterized protein n=1 Tax=Puccinia sorghi TaxID=27349 RepID=A0A0L6VFD2_9BASI|nr:hypothetical protein VP01_1857g3 [Puccinia sorghi]